ncbi:hypothetical protein QBL02_10125 [Leucobacter sp. UT-8R-CII-1-4]|uniref:hypothetical protein n=1 Tax=Leucobacter sp. UT-8R-CII-1-4 TaxID=3040075 RepID=UPI0024A9E6D4|nr:hypothetical protein [Leucobacter sp. UT-8R-CII-1-4]MDI6023899.1 hypothetical protein [Leucobacter sp. UT-8R-CII-1-4]
MSTMVMKLTALVGKSRSPGHGECFIWSRSGSDCVIAIDAGGTKSVGKQAAKHSPQILILSHDDTDHIGGAVSLINAAKKSLTELWVPTEWAILMRQLSESDPEDPLPTKDITIDMESLLDEITEKLLASDQGEGLTLSILKRAEATLAGWTSSAGSHEDSSIRFSFANDHEDRNGPYGAVNIDEILQRVKKRADALIAILKSALRRKIIIRFFSIDLALYQNQKDWEREGRPGVATLANASEAPAAANVYLPPGLPQAFAITRLSVQNRRALCTLLWDEKASLEQPVIIWSDSDGQWLDVQSPKGLAKVVESLVASSAPHHASQNPAHDRIWDELTLAPSSLLLVSAGGQHNQKNRKEYLNAGLHRGCTKCRTANPRAVQQVMVEVPSHGPARLSHTCHTSH